LLTGDFPILWNIAMSAKRWLQVAQQCKENIFAIQTLKDFQYLDDNKDQVAYSQLFVFSVTYKWVPINQGVCPLQPIPA